MNDIEEIKSRLDIVDVISGYVPLKQAGRSFKGLSPFKTEKTPSFIVSPDKNIWHDFSSGKGGDVISFVMEMEGLSFPEALELLAKRAGVKLKPRKLGDGGDNRTRLFEASEKAMAFYHLALSKNQTAKDYFIKQRGLKPEIIKKFKLGYSPDNWDSLSSYLAKQGFKPKEMITAGLCATGKRSDQPYDLFRGRAMFPVFDNQNRTIGFSARVLGDEKVAKYINTPQTPIYNKSFAIYGLAQAKEAIRSDDRVVVVEGNMDVLALHNAGFENVVACSGTALTDLQIRQLSRLTKNITLCFDSDEAGINATLRAIELATASDARIDVIHLEGAKDPDELLKKGKSSWQKALKEAKYAPDFVIEFGKRRYDTKTAPGKKQFMRFIAPMLQKLSDDIEIQHYVKKVAQIVDGSEESIIKLVKENKVGPASQKAEVVDITEDKAEPRKLSLQERQEQELLELCLAHSETLGALKDLKLSQTSELHRSIFKSLKKYDGKDFDSLIKQLPKEANYVKILSLRGEQQYADASAHDIRLEAFTQVARIQQTHRKILKSTLTRQIAEAEESGDAQKSKQLLIKYQELLNEE